MIALRGKLQRTKKEGPAPPPPDSPPAKEEWTWTGHWAFGATLPEDEKKWQKFIYRWEKPVPPSDVVVISLNNALAELVEEEEDDEKPTTPKSLEEPKPTPTTNTDKVNDDTTRANEDPASKDSTKDGNTGTADKAKEIKKEISESKEVAEPAKEESTSPKTPSGDTNSKQPIDATKGKDTEDSNKTEGKADSTQTAKVEDSTKEIPAEEKSTSESKPKDDPTSKAASAETKEMKDEPQSAAPSEEKAPAPKRAKITFATPLSPHDPPFTDASVKYPDKCPAGGQWKGHFENAIVTKVKRKNNSAPPPIQKIEETFHIYLNATPANQAQTWFATDEIAPASSKKKKTETATPAEPVGVLKEGLVHVRGTGENQFGTFELLGSFDVETGVLECQRMYVQEAVPAPRRRRSRSVGGAGGNKTSSDGRPYFTRKRPMSWKRRTFFGAGGSDNEGGDGPGTGEKRRRNSSVGGGAASAGGGKRVRVNEPKSTTPEGGPSIIAKAAATMAAGLSITIPPASGARRPGPSPKTGTPRSKKAGTGSGASTPSSAKASSTPSTSSSSMYMKLPPVGDPKMAVWRGAHYLYYQKNDPSQEEGGSGSNTNSGSNAANNAFKYVVYEGEMFKSQREGRGVCLYSNQMLYEGEWKRNKEHGKGTLMTADRKKIIYNGEWERGRMHGKGTFYYSSGVVLNSRQQVVISDEGRGKKKSNPSGGSGAGSEAVESKYEGDFKENLRHGYGKYILPDGSSYDGMWREGMMCGRGLFAWADGSWYSGEWKEGRRHGNGMLKVSDGFVYEGQWVQNAMEGRGTATYPNGQTYNGMFSNGRREGRGTIRFTNGAIYEGRFRDDAIDGQGTMKMSRIITVLPEKPKVDHQEEPEQAKQGQGEADEKSTAKGEAKVAEKEDEIKPDFMIPLSFQSDMGHIHQKAGFTVGGD